MNSDATEADAAGADIIHISPRLINAQLASSPTSAAGFYRPLTKTADDFDSDGYNGDDVDDDDIVLLPSYNDTPMSELATSRSHDRLLHDESLEEEPTATTVTTTSPSEFVKRHLHDRLHKSSLFEATINFTNSIVGAGIIGLPFALKQAGFGAGITLLVGLTVVVGNRLVRV